MVFAVQCFYKLAHRVKFSLTEKKDADIINITKDIVLSILYYANLNLMKNRNFQFLFRTEEKHEKI